MLQDDLLSPRPPWVRVAIEAVARHRFLTAAQIAALVGSTVSDVAPVVDALVGERLLVRLHPTRGLDGPDAAPAFALTRRGATVLAAATGGAPTVPNPRRSLLMLGHELAVNDVAIVLELLHAKQAIRLLRWETARERIAAHAVVHDRGGIQRTPLVADALAVIECSGKVSALLVEVDRGTVSVSLRMRVKYAGYLSWARAGGAMQRFGIKSLRVLTTAPSPARLARLRDAAIAASDGAGARLLWFALQSDVRVHEPERLLDAIFTTAHTDDSLRTLFTAPSPHEADAPAPAHPAASIGPIADAA